MVEMPMDVKVEVALISMPFGPQNAPSLGLGLLKSALDIEGIPTRIYHFNLAFARHIGATRYDEIADTVPARTDLVGEWLFNGNLFEEHRLDTDGYIRDVLRGGLPQHHSKRNRGTCISDEWIAWLLEVRGQTKPFLERCLATVLTARPRIVGFSSIFQEHVPSLALARLVKRAAPDTLVVLGGSNCEGPMGVETVRQFPFIDAVVSGEGDIVFPELVHRVIAGASFTELPGVYTPASVRGLAIAGAPPTATPVKDMDALPFPDFDDYFEQLEALGLDADGPDVQHLMFETARGCWWGQKQHCTFCGLNGLTMAFRSKAPARALDELMYLTNRHPGRPVQVSDNILDMNYLKTLLPELADRELPVSIFYETKANLKKDHVRLLRDARVDRIQPGIESFSSQILRLMRKGVTGIQNIQLLKWCRELEVTPAWGILCGFPGEDPAEYSRMASLIPLLTHLTPPSGDGVTRIRLDRFSPNHDRAEEYGFRRVAPFPAYHYVYPIETEALSNLAYFFSYEYQEERDVAGYTQAVDDAIKAWRREHTDSALFFVDKDDALLVWDLRRIAHRPLQTLTGLPRVLYQACDEASSLRRLQEVVREATGQPVATEELEDMLVLLLDRGLMVKEDGLYLSLAIRLGEYVPSAQILERFLAVVRELGEEEDGTTLIGAERGCRLQAGGG
jgi:ribosomal peptide maturation radical SAM protein 1